MTMREVICTVCGKIERRDDALLDGKCGQPYCKGDVVFSKKLKQQNKELFLSLKRRNKLSPSTLLFWESAQRILKK